MSRLFLTYFFATFFVASIAVPTYLSLSELACEYSIVLNDLDDDSEQTEKTNDLDIKIIHVQEELIAYNLTECETKIPYFSSEYNSLSQKLDSPPPEYTL